MACVGGPRSHWPAWNLYRYLDRNNQCKHTCMLYDSILLASFTTETSGVRTYMYVCVCMCICMCAYVCVHMYCAYIVLLLYVRMCLQQQEGIATCDLVCCFYPSLRPKVLGQDDTFWWQACKYGSHSAAGLIPSQQLEERRRAYTLGENGAVGCLGRRKQKRQLLYSSHHNGCEWVWSLIMGRVANAE